MTLVLGSVADDYTGASDLANTLARAGLRTVQTIGVPSPELDFIDADAIVVALKSRSIPAENAVALSRKAADWLRKQGARHVLFKICSTFDSTDQGNIGQVMDALRADAGSGPVVVTPAFPETGRTVYLGNLFVGTVPLNESPLKDHPLNPMRDSNLVRVLARQSAHPVGLIPFATVEAGEAALQKAMGQLAEEGKGSAIVDTILDRHLQVIGAAALQNPISVGASGLGLGLARALVAAKQCTVRQAQAVSEMGVGGKVAILAGSCSQATLEQIRIAESTLPVLRLDVARLLAGEPVAMEALNWASEKLGAGPVLIASSATPEVVAALQAQHKLNDVLQAQHGPNHVGALIEHCLAEIGEGLVERGVRRLIVAGGETSGAIVDRLGIKAFRVGPEIAPGVPVLRSAGDARAMLLALKSGNFGGRDFFARALGMMQ
jgi:uncharacterized protein YgbK (DUF1537 family)